MPSPDVLIRALDIEALPVVPDVVLTPSINQYLSPSKKVSQGKARILAPVREVK
jgi:hypothetical protein